MRRSRVLAIDFDGVRLATSLQSLLIEEPSLEIRIEEANGSPPKFSKLANSSWTDLVILCISGQTDLAPRALEASRARFPGAPVVIATETATAREWVDLVKLDVADFIMPPFKRMEVLPRLWRLL